MSEEQIKIPVWEKYALTIQEGAAYFGVGERRLRQIAVEHSSADFLLHVGVNIFLKDSCSKNS